MTNKTNQLPDKQREMIEGLLTKVQSMSEADFKSFLNGMAKFHNYSFYNRCLIQIQGASQVAGMKQWNKQGRKVKKGSKAIKILAPSMLYQVKEKGEWKRVGKVAHSKYKGEKRAFPVSFFEVSVFDISQTEGKDLPEPMTEKSNIGYEQVLNAAEKLGYTVEKRPLEYNLGGYISKREITINANRKETANVGTLIHELAHGELGHTDTNRPHTRELAEQQAETVTYLVCQQLGVERKSEFYLKSWKLSDDILKDFNQLSRVADKLVRTIKPNSSRFITED